jgi:hypothetical protein
VNNGTFSAADAALAAVKQQQALIQNVQNSMNEQFQQLELDVTLSPLNVLGAKIDRQWGDFEENKEKFVLELTWADIDELSSRLTGENGTSGAFDLLAKQMAAKPGSTVKDPLGSYAVLMRLRLSQATFLMTRNQPLTQNQLRIYRDQVEKLNLGFANATRSYFQKAIEPIVGTSGVYGWCGQNVWGSWYFMINQGYSSSDTYGSPQACETARRDWVYQTEQAKRNPIINSTYAQQENFVNWKKRKNTLHVQSATFQGSDETKSLRLMCNARETCSIPAGKVVTRIGINASKPTGNLDVTYICIGDEQNVRKGSFAPDSKQDVVLSCNPLRAISGEYIDTSHDSTTPRTPEDYVSIVPTASRPRIAIFDWSSQSDPSKALQIVTYTNSYASFIAYYDDGGIGAPWPLTWGENGVPIRVRTDRQVFDYVSPPTTATSPETMEALLGAL